MIKNIEKALFGDYRKKKAVNQLNNILYGQLANSNHVVWYNFEDKKDYINKGYASNAQVYSIVKKILDKAKDAPLILYEGESDAFKRTKYSNDLVTKAMSNVYRKKDLEYNTDSDLYELLQHPNDKDTLTDILSLLGIFYFVQGEAFLYRETASDSDIALSLHVAPANLMTPVFSKDENDIIEGWRLNLMSGHERTLDAKDVMQFKMPNPVFDSMGSQLRGMSPLIAGGRFLLQSDTGISSWVKALENEGAKGIVAPKGNDPKLWLNPDQVELTRDRLDKRIHGNDNLHKIAVSGMPLEYHQIGLSPQALNIISGLEFSDIKLCQLWNIHPVLFDAKPTYENLKNAQLQLVTDVVIPYLNTLEQALMKWLVKPFSERDGKSYLVDFDTSGYVELQLNVETAIKLWQDGLITLNEARGMLNWDDVEDENADQIFIEATKVPLSDYSWQD